MSDRDWFQRQLLATADGAVWAIRQIPVDKRDTPSPRHPERWTPARTLFHLLTYERDIALPTLRLWLGGPPFPYHSQEEVAATEEAAWQAQRPAVEDMLAAFQATNQTMLDRLPHLAPVAWDESRDALWGPATLRWAITKTYQHRLEHTSDILRFSLWTWRV